MCASWWKGRRNRGHRPLPLRELPTSNMAPSFVSMATTAAQEAWSYIIQIHRPTCVHASIYKYIFVYTHAPEKLLSTGDSIIMEKPERENISSYKRYTVHVTPTTCFCTKVPKIHTEEKTASSTKCAGETKFQCV